MAEPEHEPLSLGIQESLELYTDSYTSCHLYILAHLLAHALELDFQAGIQEQWTRTTRGAILDPLFGELIAFLVESFQILCRYNVCYLLCSRMT